jgi:hypothetical protein
MAAGVEGFAFAYEQFCHGRPRIRKNAIGDRWLTAFSEAWRREANAALFGRLPPLFNADVGLWVTSPIWPLGSLGFLRLSGMLTISGFLKLVARLRP